MDRKPFSAPRPTQALNNLSMKQIDHLQRNKDNNDPFQERTVPVLQQVFEKFQIFPDDLQALPDIPVPFLQIKGLF